MGWVLRRGSGLENFRQRIGQRLVKVVKDKQVASQSKSQVSLGVLAIILWLGSRGQLLETSHRKCFGHWGEVSSLDNEGQ